jgi:molecular chaperone HtpG
MKAQALRDSNMSSYMMSKKTMEINPHHIIIKALKDRLSNENNNSLQDLVNLIFESSLIASGFNIEEPATFVNRINKMIKLGLSLDEEEEAEAEKEAEAEAEAEDEKEKEAEEETSMEDVD